MVGFLRNVLICSAIGFFLALVFLTPAGALVGAVNGLLVGVCVTLGELRARDSENAVVPTGPIRLIGSQ
jgi:hypothetical protein